MPDESDVPEERLDDEASLDPAVEARRQAAVSLLRRYGDPILRSAATPVDRFDSALRDQVAHMGAIMRDALGVGLAAPQLGLSQRLLVYRIGPDAPLVALVNPEIEWRSEDDTEPLEEGCLSIPGVAVEVERPVHVRVHARDEHGEPQLVEASGHEARVIQHEVDHLDGVLMLDRATKEARREALRALREREPERTAA